MKESPDDRHDQDIPTSPRGALLPDLRSVHARNRGAREQEKMLQEAPCLLAGHHWQPLRDLRDGSLVLVCEQGCVVDWTSAREFHDHPEAR